MLSSTELVESQHSMAACEKLPKLLIFL